MEWSDETYRLDEIEDKYSLPCVIQVNEGYYSETDTEGFSTGDILSIDKKVTLHKVSANFVRQYVDLKEREILVPLNYKGKLKVHKEVKTYYKVSDLAEDFPRFAVLLQNFIVTTGQDLQIEIKYGTVIELDRIIPGNTYGPKIEPDKLVVMFQHLGEETAVGIPCTDRGKFRTQPDDNTYTIKEAIDRYSLPQYVQFIDDEIKRVYTQDLMEGLANAQTFTVTETLRLNRLLTQTVLVGHYKPIDEAPTDEGDTRQRTLIVLPLDNKDIREIEVNVLEGATEQDYETIFRVRNVSNTDELVDGSLYVDFAMSTPGVKRISHPSIGIEGVEAPPVPPRPGPTRRGGKPPAPVLADSQEYLVPAPGLHAPKGTKTKTQVKQTKAYVPINPPENKPFGKAPLPIPADDTDVHEDLYEEVDESKIMYKPTVYRSNSKAAATSTARKPGGYSNFPPLQIARISPETRDQQKKMKLFKDLTCDELVARLEYCGLSDFAQTCRAERLNGAFFENISAEKLRSTTRLAGIQLAKFIQMRDSNWIPS